MGYIPDEVTFLVLSEYAKQGCAKYLCLVSKLLIREDRTWFTNSFRCYF